MFSGAWMANGAGACGWLFSAVLATGIAAGLLPIDSTTAAPQTSAGAAPAAPAATAVPPGPAPIAPPAAQITAPPSEPAPAKPAAGVPPLAAASPVPLPPEDPRLAQVYSIFDSACVQCHQTGRLTGPTAAAGLANILDLGTLAREPRFVRPGLPDASKLYQVLMDRHRPVDLGQSPVWPDAESIQRVRTWIEETRGGCSGPKTTDTDTAAAINAAAIAAGEVEARELRFVSLAHLANACATPLEMEAYRQGVSKLLNSLSWGARPVVPVPVDGAKTILSFKLADIGWVDEHWTALARAEPQGLAHDLTGLVTAPGANARSIRGDWMAWSASQPPFYAELLGIPATLDETARLLGIKRDGEIGSARGTRAGIRGSAITRGPRVIEAYHAETRALWLAYDFLDGGGERDVFDRPLGGLKDAPELAQFRADGQRLMFSLPNGFAAFALLSADGHRIDQLPPRLDIEPSRLMGPTTAGLSCLSCHTGGPKPFSDSMRAHLTSEKFTGTRDVKDLALSVYQTGNEWLPVFDEDGFRYRRALIQAGIDPDLTIHGLEPLSALARRYLLPADFTTAAAEAGLAPSDFESRIAGTIFEDTTLVPRLRQGALARTEINRVLAALARASGPANSGIAGAPPPAETSMKLALWTDRASYKTGDLVTIFAQPSLPCHLTIISVNGTGKATVLFPNELDPENLVPQDTPTTVPSPAAQYQFRFKDKGAETIIATCQTVAQFPAGIEPDYERQRFTILGSFENFLRTSYSLDTDAQRASARAAAEKARPAVVKTPPKDAKPDTAKPDTTKPEQTARTAVRVEIE